MTTGALLEMHRTGTRGRRKEEDKETQRRIVRGEEAKKNWRISLSDEWEKEVQVEMLMRWRVRELWVSEKPRPFEPQGKPAVHSKETGWRRRRLSAW